MIEVVLALADRVVPAVATGKGSQARREGWDVMFVVCRRKCGARLKAALQEEITLFREILAPDAGPRRAASE